MILRGFILTILVTTLLTSCIIKRSTEGQSNMVYNYSKFKFLLESFIKERAGYKESVISVELVKTNDSIVVMFANSFPDLRKTKYIGSDSLYEKRIYFIGDTSIFIYSVREVGNVPIQLKKFMKEMDDISRPVITMDPRIWGFYFKDSTLVDYYPASEINKYLKLAQ